MTPDELRQPATKADVAKIEEKLDRALVALHGDGSKDNPGLFHRVTTIEEKFGSIMKNIGAVWTGGLTVASFVVGNWIWERFKN